MVLPPPPQVPSLGMRLVGLPSRQLWLACLGATALSVRTVNDLWRRLLAEGEVAERSLLGPSVAPPEH